VSEFRVEGSGSADALSAVANESAAEEQWRAVRRAMPPLRVEVPDETLAETLMRRLRPLEAESVPVDGYFEVGVQLHERNPEQRVVRALSSIDAWLVTTGLASVRVHVDGCSHTLHVLSERTGSGADERPPEAA
jgi:hypothetical protein